MCGRRRPTSAPLRRNGASRVPNVSLGPRYERDESRTLFAGLELQVDVPVINTGRETVWQGETEVRRKQVALEQLRIKARLEIESAVERYERARAIVEQFRPGAAGELDQEVARVADLFLAGQTDLLTLYSIRGKVLQSQRDYLDALNQLAQAAADLTAATATPYTALATLNPQASDR
jgi:outer membrane protein TolC